MEPDVASERSVRSICVQIIVAIGQDRRTAACLDSDIIAKNSGVIDQKSRTRARADKAKTIALQAHLVKKENRVSRAACTCGKSGCNQHDQYNGLCQ